MSKEIYALESTIVYLKLNHQKLDAYSNALTLARHCYRWTSALPADERFNLVQQIRRAAISVILNLAEGCSRKSAIERKRFFEIARGSMIEIDAALDIAGSLGYCDSIMLEPLGKSLVECFGSISGLITSATKSTNPQNP